MPKLLDVDSLVVNEKVLRIGGVDYPVIERTVRQVITAIQFEKKIEKASEQNQIEMMVQMVSEVIPSCPKEELYNLPIVSLNKILLFINESEQEAGSEDQAADTEGK